MGDGRYARPSLEKEGAISPNPSPNSSGLSSQSCLIRAIEIRTGAAFWQLFDSDELFHRLPQSMMLSSNMHESQIMTHSSAKS
jgi:hypothetical protein